MLEPPSFSTVSDSIADGTGQRAARVVDAWKRDSVRGNCIQCVCASVAAVVVAPYLFLRLRVRVFVRTCRFPTCIRACACVAILVELDSRFLERVPCHASVVSRCPLQASRTYLAKRRTEGKKRHFSKQNAAFSLRVLQTGGNYPFSGCTFGCQYV